MVSMQLFLVSRLIDKFLHCIEWIGFSIQLIEMIDTVDTWGSLTLE